MPINIDTLRERMYQLNQPRDYYLALTDEERQSMERTAFNFFVDKGRKLKIAPRLFSDLAARGTNMKYMEKSLSLESWGAQP